MFEDIAKFAKSQEGNGVNVVSAFPGTGKSYFVTQMNSDVLDSDSSTFPKNKFPGNYLNHIEARIKEGKSLLVSSHEDVRKELEARKIPFILAYPEESCLDEYIKRYETRGSPPAFIELLRKNWLGWIRGCQKQGGCQHAVLNSGLYLSDRLVQRDGQFFIAS